jgi:sulfite reductase alpha subunit-like flavoprotein
MPRVNLDWQNRRLQKALSLILCLRFPQVSTHLRALVLPTAMSACVHHVELAEVDGNNDISDRKILILYATETGTAQDVADRIARECRRGFFQCRVCNIGSYPPVSDSLPSW